MIADVNNDNCCDQGIKSVQQTIEASRDIQVIIESFTMRQWTLLYVCNDDDGSVHTTLRHRTVQLDA